MQNSFIKVNTLDEHLFYERIIDCNMGILINWNIIMSRVFLCIGFT